MGFNPSPNQYFRLFFKHSGKCIDAGSIHRGERLRQETAVKKDSQLFRFRNLPELNSGRHYVIECKLSGKWFDVANGSHAIAGPVIQWDPSVVAFNEHFALIHTGDGYYQIQARHSGLFLCAENASTDSGPIVVQGPGPGDHYRFRFAPADYLEPSSTSNLISDSSAQLRDLIIKVASKAPNVGGGLGILLGILWPAQDKEHRLWEQMKLYVTELVRELLTQERLISLEHRLTGLRNNLAGYNTEAVGSQSRKGFFEGLLTSLNNAEEDFFDPRNPERQLPYFVAMGTIHLAVLREFYMDYELIYREPDQTKAAHLQQLKDKIEKYSKGEKASRENATAWRLDQITIAHRTEGSVIKTDYWTVRDPYAGWSREFSSSTGGSQVAAEKALDDRKNEVRSQFGADLDIFLAPARLWRYLDPEVTAKPVQVFREVTTGPVGGLSQYTPFADDPHGQRITKIVIHAGTKIDGIEFFYGEHSGGFHGQPGGSRHEFGLGDDEYITDVWGRAGNALDAIEFGTNKGRTFGAGGQRGNAWGASPPDHLGAKLYKIFGRAGTGHIEAIGFVWRYALEE